MQGPRALERALTAEVARLTAELPGAATSRALSTLLQHPILIVVPSRSLREHLGQTLAHAGALLGLRILTLEALAHDVLARAGEPCVDTPLHALQVRRFARQEPTLAGALDRYDDGYQVVAAAVDDLLDAGLEPAHSEFLLERAEALEGAVAAARVASVIRVATQVAAQQEAFACHRAERLARARRAIEMHPEVALPVRRLLIAGFQDATGVQADLLEALVRRRDALVFFEHPADPLLRSEPADFGVFGERLRARLGGIAGLEHSDHAERPPRIEVVRAPDREAEVRDLAARLRALLDAGVVPERVGVVARDLGPYRAALRRQLARMSLPFSGCGEPGPAGPARARLDALLALLEKRERTGTEAWLDAVVALLPEEPAKAVPLGFREAAALRRALHRRGCVQLRDLARLSTGSGSLEVASRAARALLGGLETLVRDRTLAEHAAALRGLVCAALGWDAAAAGEGGAALAELDAVLGSPSFAAVGMERLAFDEWSALLRRALSGAARGMLGGSGGGVQLQSVMEARSRSFEVLFVLGLNRGVFPRTVVDDPFLPDRLRARLRDVLPELPVKAEGHDEERFLFAQLLAAAPQVVLSCAAEDEDGHPLGPSPLLEHLVNAGVPDSVREAPPLHAEWVGDTPRPAAEHALLAGLRGGLAAQESLLPAVLGAQVGDPQVQARARVVRELDAYRGPGGELGPYFGFVTPLRESDAPPVTFLERVLRCPWSAYLSRVLRLEAPPDALTGLPRTDNEYLLIGNVVHGALDRLVAQQLPAVASAAQVGESAGHAVAWPEADVVAKALLESAELSLERAEIPVPGYAQVLARRAAAYLEVARRADWADGAVMVLGVEQEGRAMLPAGKGARREVRFRADRVDRAGGRLRLTDYKTGRPRIPKSAEGEKLLDALAARQLLQAVVYAASEPGAVGRYLFLRPDDPDSARERSVALASEGLPEALEAAVATAFGALDTGAFIPRLRSANEDKEPDACRRCDVKEACLRGDSGARGRIARFMEGRDPGRGGAAQQAATALWQLEVGK